MKSYIQKSVVGVIICSLFFISVSQPVAAYTEKEVLIAKLQIMLEELFAQLALITQPTESSGGKNLAVGSTIVTTGSTKLRHTPGLNLDAVEGRGHAAGDKGTITAGPNIVDGYTWYYVDYANGSDGWVAADRIKAFTAVAAQPTVPPAAPTCLISTDKERYTLRDEIKLAWSVPGTKFVMFSNKVAFKDGLTMPEGVQPSTGNATVKADIIGVDTITVNGYADYGAAPKVTCKTTVTIDNYKRSFGAKDIVSVKKSVITLNPNLATDDYEEYTISLKSGEEFTLAIVQSQYAVADSFLKLMDTLVRLKIYWYW